jgi:CRP/FNR family transcriptional regulator, cyclic AMP receptor protein
VNAALANSAAVGIASREGELEILDARNREEESRPDAGPVEEVLEAPVLCLDGSGPPAEADVAYVVLDGLLMRRLTVAGGHSLELLSRGSVLLPEREDAASFARFEWRVVEPTRLARLAFSPGSRLRRRPTLLAAILRRAIDRSRVLALQSATMSIVGVEERLQALLWALAERWGRVTPDGVELELPIQQAALAEMVGARRSTVNVALGNLAERGLLASRAPGRWLLRGAAPAAGSPAI